MVPIVENCPLLPPVGGKLEMDEIDKQPSTISYDPKEPDSDVNAVLSRGFKDPPGATRLAYKTKQKSPHMTQMKTIKTNMAEHHWKKIEDHEHEGDESVRLKEEPFNCAMKNDWEGLKHYYGNHPGEVDKTLTLDGDTAIHVAASCSTKSQGKVVLEFLINLLPTDEEKCRALRRPNKHGNNALHEAAVAGNLEAVKFLVVHFNIPADITTIDDENDTITTTDDENDTFPLLETRNKLGETPMYRAAALGYTELVQFFAGKLEDNQKIPRKNFYRKDKMSILHIAVVAQKFETALWLVKNHHFLAQEKEDKGFTSLQLLAQMPTAFRPEFHQSKWKMLIYYCLPAGDLVSENQKDDEESRLPSNHPRQSIYSKMLSDMLKVYTFLWYFLVKGRPGNIINNIWTAKKNKKSLDELIKLLVENDYSWMKHNLKSNLEKYDETVSLGSGKKLISDYRGTDKKENEAAEAKATKSEGYNVSNYTPLVIATITGIEDIVSEIMRQYPQATEHVSEHGQNILHLAIKHRHKKIFEIIKKKPTIKDRLSARIDNDGNTVLHQAADRSYYAISMSQELIGPAMQLQEELHWISRVQKIVPPHYIMHHNKFEQTAEVLFNDQHNELLQEAQKWIKETAESCSTVAVLVASVVFAAGYAIPGGNRENGLPVFHGTPAFWVFTCMDVLAIAFSLSSVSCFLSILSSPLEYPVFIHGVPRKLMCGFILLFLSMATTMVAFIATIFLLLRVEKKWTKSLLYLVALLPVSLFGLMQFPLLHSCKGIFKKIKKIFRPLFLPFLGLSKRRSTWDESKAH